MWLSLSCEPSWKLLPSFPQNGFSNHINFHDSRKGRPSYTVCCGLPGQPQKRTAPVFWFLCHNLTGDSVRLLHTILQLSWQNSLFLLLLRSAFHIQVPEREGSRCILGICAFTQQVEAGWGDRTKLRLSSTATILPKVKPSKNSRYRQQCGEIMIIRSTCKMGQEVFW